MARHRLDIAYDGTDFHGWQRQRVHADRLTLSGSSARVDDPLPGDPDDGRVELRTVQRALERAAWGVLRLRVDCLGASRTDAGVHAAAQCAVFDTPEERVGPPDERLADALNAKLPEDVLVLRCERADDGFDPIGDCLAKGYSYTVQTGRRRPLWDRRYVCHVPRELDVGAMEAAAEPMAGEHDFAAFTNAGHGRESTVRRVDACGVTACEGGRVRVDVSGGGFLYNMVRIIAGTLIEAGRGKVGPERVAEALATGDRTLAGATAPPQGLRLEWIAYAEAPPTGGLGNPASAGHEQPRDAAS